MALTKFKVSGKEFVIVPSRDYERMAALLAEEARDVRKAKAALAHYRKTGRGVSLRQLKREMAS